MSNRSCLTARRPRTAWRRSVLGPRLCGGGADDVASLQQLDVLVDRSVDLPVSAHLERLSVVAQLASPLSSAPLGLLGQASCLSSSRWAAHRPIPSGSTGAEHHKYPTLSSIDPAYRTVGPGSHWRGTWRATHQGSRFASKDRAERPVAAPRTERGRVGAEVVGLGSGGNGRPRGASTLANGLDHLVVDLASNGDGVGQVVEADPLGPPTEHLFAEEGVEVDPLQLLPLLRAVRDPAGLVVDDRVRATPGRKSIRSMIPRNTTPSTTASSFCSVERTFTVSGSSRRRALENRRAAAEQKSAVVFRSSSRAR